MNKIIKKDVLVIGAGPSGLAAACKASERGLKVAVIDSNPLPARKLLATGNGHCNYSNKKAEHSEEIVSIMRSLIGIEPAFEEDRIYPRSMEASSVAEGFMACLEKLGAEVFCGEKAVSVHKNAPGFEVQCESGKQFAAGSVVLATGGKAGIQYGCYGDGYRFAKELGHSVNKPVPALDGLCCAEDLEAVHGVRVNAKARLLKKTEGSDFEEIRSENGEVQFTKNAISGICVMDLARFVRLSEGTAYRLCVDLFPEKTEEELAGMLSERKKNLGIDLERLIPQKLEKYIKTRHKGLSALGLAKLSKNLSFTVTGTRGWKTAQVTSGGVPLEEVDALSFESLKTNGLYVTGELLDYDGPCGGFNINWALHTGFAAGKSIPSLKTEK